MNRALEYQNSTQEEIDDTTPLFRSKTSPAPIDREDSIGGFNRSFTSSTLLDRDVSTSPGSSISGEDVSESGTLAGSDRTARKISTPTKKIRDSSNIAFREWQPLSPTPIKSEDSYLQASRRSLSEKSSPGTEDVYYKAHTPNVATVVHEAMQELSKIRHRELSVRRLKIRPQDPNHQADEAFKQRFQESAEYEMADRRLNSKDWLRLGTWWLLKARFNLQLVGRSRAISPPSNANRLVYQAYIDILKASWILYDNVLKENNLGPLQTNESLKLFYNLSDVSFSISHF